MVLVDQRQKTAPSWSASAFRRLSQSQRHLWCPACNLLWTVPSRICKAPMMDLAVMSTSSIQAHPTLTPYVREARVINLSPQPASCCFCATTLPPPVLLLGSSLTLLDLHDCTLRERSTKSYMLNHYPSKPLKSKPSS